MVKTGKSLSVVVLAFVLSLGVVTVPMTSTVGANPGEIRVPDDYPTIQAAIDAASPGDTLNVAAGTYEENIQIPEEKQNLGLIGAGRENTFIIGPDETGLVVIIGAGGVTFTGFTVRGGTTGGEAPGYGVGIIGASGCVIEDNIITENELGIGIIGGSGLQNGESWDLVSDNSIIRGNKIYNNTGSEMSYGVMVMNCSDTIIEENEIYDNGQMGIVIMGGKLDMDYDGEWDRWGECKDSQILGNEVYGHTSEDMSGIFILNSSGNTISGNELYENLAAVTIIGLTSEEYGFEGEATENCISDNNIHDNSDGGIGLLGTGENCYSNNITGNTIDNNGHGIWIEGAANTQIVGNDVLNNTGVEDSGIHVQEDSSGTTEVHYNNIEGNSPEGSESYGVYNHPDNPVLDATNNWWGDASGPSGAGPGTGDAVSDNVDYSPWLKAEITSVVTGLVSIEDKLEVVYGFHDGTWTRYNPSWPPAANTLSMLYKGRGYWVNVSEVCDLTYEANTYELDEGWNLIGWLGW